MTIPASTDGDEHSGRKVIWTLLSGREHEENNEKKAKQSMRQQVPAPPKGWHRFLWYGSGVVYLAASVGQGEFVFSPRVGARYSLAFLWAVVLVVIFRWGMIREAGRYTVVTGRSILHGIEQMPGSRYIGIGLIAFPQLAQAAITLAGLTAFAGSALHLILPGSNQLYATILLVLTASIVIAGQYGLLQHITTVVTGIVVLIILVAAASVLPGFGPVLRGLVPTLPPNTNLYFIVPWFGTMLTQAAGLLWFSYWVGSSGLGGGFERGEESKGEHEQQQSHEQAYSRLRSWIRTMTIGAALGSIGGGLVDAAFVLLGAELLAPHHIFPSGFHAAKDLTTLLSGLWGPVGYWLLLSSIIGAMTATVLSREDGWGRVFASATSYFLPKRLRPDQPGSPPFPPPGAGC